MVILIELLRVYSQRELAGMIGTTPTRVSLWKNGKSGIQKKYLRALTDLYRQEQDRIAAAGVQYAKDAF